MIRILKMAILFFGLLFLSCNSQRDNFEAYLPSPDSGIHVYFYLNNGEPYYMVFHDDEIVIDWSLLGFKLSDNINVTNDLILVETRSKMDNTEETVLDTTFMKGDYNEIILCLEKQIEPFVGFDLIMRAYNNGIAFRYLLNARENEINYQLVSEETWFSLYSDTFKWNKIKDTLTIPSTLIADQQFEVILNETKVSGYPESVFIKHVEDNYRFSNSFKRTSELNPIMFEAGVKSPWRIITINEIINRKKDE